MATRASLIVPEKWFFETKIIWYFKGINYTFFTWTEVGADGTHLYLRFKEINQQRRNSIWNCKMMEEFYIWFWKSVPLITFYFDYLKILAQVIHVQTIFHLLMNNCLIIKVNVHNVYLLFRRHKLFPSVLSDVNSNWQHFV